MDTKNLDRYGNAALEWARVERQLEAQPGSPGLTYWLATVGANGQPHITGVGAVWLDGKVYFTSGPGTSKSRNLSSNPRCSVSASLEGIDLVIEGEARRVTDGATLRALAEKYVEMGWPATVEADALTAPFSAPSAGPAPWHLYALEPRSAVGVAKIEPFGATRWRFP
ncbi:MAG: pyridoxamine 5'-phosphate oxidase family protein [Chloroflexi bacterium]|nr:pyridoxamine 5'-phosphate oxidase family protein [Chloroflexota bacterium]